MAAVLPPIIQEPIERGGNSSSLPANEQLLKDFKYNSYTPKEIKINNKDVNVLYTTTSIEKAREKFNTIIVDCTNKSMPNESIGETIRIKHTSDSYSQVTQNEGKYYILKFKDNKYILGQFYHHPLLLVRTNDYYVISKSTDGQTIPIPLWTKQCSNKIKLTKENIISSELSHNFSVDKNLYGGSYSNIKDSELFNNIGESYTLNLIKSLSSQQERA